MTLSLADEIRANTAAIVAQLRGFSKQPPHLQKVTLPAPFFSQIADRMEALQAEVNAPKPCAECGTHSNLFEIDTARERPGYIALERANIDRLKEGSPGMDAVAAEIERLRNAGLRDRAINATKGCL